MKEKDVLEKCLSDKITLNQYFFIWCIEQKSHNKWYESSKFVSIASTEEIQDLIDRGFIINKNFAGRPIDVLYLSLPDNHKISVKDSEDLFDELYQAYPPVFPLGDGKMFIARTGGSKEELGELYAKKLKESNKTHEFVIEQLSRYITLVKNNKINGRRLFDFINESMWDIVAAISDETGKSMFKEDI